MLKSVNVNGKSNPGFSSGDAIIAVQLLHSIYQNLYHEFWIDQREIIAGNQAIGVLLSLIFVYFLLLSTKVI
jgi:HAE1 family hydrophobic/amphiphilic exporter-1